MRKRGTVCRRVPVPPKSSVSKHESLKKEGVGGRQNREENGEEKKKKVAHNED